MSSTQATERPDPRTYIGGADAAAICGIHPYRTPEMVVKEKLGLTEPEPQSYRMAKGLHLEELISEWYTKQTGVALELIPFQRHPRHGNLGGHPDRVCYRDDKMQLVEIKSTNDRNLYQNGEIPEWHQAQVMHYGMLLNAHVDLEIHPEALLIVDRGKAEPEVLTMPLDPRKMDKLRDEELAFWLAYVETRVLPDPANSAEALARWPENTQDVVEVRDPHFIAELEELEALKGEEKVIHERREAVELAIKRRLGDAGTALYKGKVACTWKTRNTERLDLKALQVDPSPEAQKIRERHTYVSTSRVLLPKKGLKP